jgi:hypothetical protein
MGFQWYAIVVYWQFVAVSIGESAFKAAPDEAGFEDAAGRVGIMKGGQRRKAARRHACQLPRRRGPLRRRTGPGHARGVTSRLPAAGGSAQNGHDIRSA